jgi:hypothetical protein
MIRKATLFLSALVLASCGANNAPPPPGQPAGQAESTKTKALATGADVLQSNTPVRQLDIYLVGFHPMKDNPSVQMEAHHYCKQVNEDFAQCALFDGNTKDANLNGIEYIVSERLFNTFPEEEKKYWHPHNYEILSGELIGPGLPKAAEKQLMKGKMNSYGKTWHVWMTDNNGKPGDKLPMGAPHLAWSFNRDGEAQPGLVERRDKKMSTDTTQVRQDRQDLVPLAHPQSGVDDLKGKFPGKTQPIPGVRDVKDAQK